MMFYGSLRGLGNAKFYIFVFAVLLTLYGSLKVLLFLATLLTVSGWSLLSRLDLVVLRIDLMACGLTLSISFATYFFCVLWGFLSGFGFKRFAVPLAVQGMPFWLQCLALAITASRFWVVISCRVSLLPICTSLRARHVFRCAEFVAMVL